MTDMKVKAYDIRALAADADERFHSVARSVLEAANTADDEDVVIVKVPRGRGAEVVSACTSDHFVYFNRGGWHVMHPLSERLNGDLLACPLNGWMRTNFVDDRGYRGRHRAERVEGGWKLTKAADR